MWVLHPVMLDYWDLQLLLNLQILRPAHTVAMVSAHAFIAVNQLVLEK